MKPNFCGLLRISELKNSITTFLGTSLKSENYQKYLLINAKQFLNTLKSMIYFSGCARGFLGILDTCYAMQEWCEGHKSVLQILAERESIYRLLPQTTHENLSKDHKSYAPNPMSR